ncbi:Lrp/AsnC family transcriptional regulator [Pararhizobium sp. YC-54]|uniref:Lrp/AsnC family transcriptional regulator n=1 Tax=Pararhizobium sp. YC-54 TaxID=2986920 RepID=UPI0021F7310D|nr:Lrp/AsnC family transcriptional regulator [Pararhizobium sp. YC-54]MCV9999325.1 Lrp/AsnC family transcriptional regulator [Pararhizobium sp. YC-54]
MAPLDHTEKQIIRLLQDDGRMSTAEIARRLGISEPTVRKKLNQLTQEGRVRVRATADPVDLGYEASAFIGIDVERDSIIKVAKVLQQYSFVDSVAVTTGPYDLIIKACFQTLRDLYDFILVELAAVEGIKDSNSLMILQTIKNDGLIGVAGLREGSVNEMKDNEG